MSDSTPIVIFDTVDFFILLTYTVGERLLRTTLHRQDTVPNGEHLYRFVETIARRIRTKHRGKPAPSMQTVRGGLQHVCQVLVEQYEHFALTKHWASKCDSLLNKLVKEGAQTKGRWAERQYIGFQTLRIIGDASMSKALKEGIISWDVYISRHLSVVLVASLASRGGDVTRSVLYERMECLCWKDITLTFVGGDTLDHLSMDIVLRHVKGYK